MLHQRPIPTQRKLRDRISETKYGLVQLLARLQEVSAIGEEVRLVERDNRAACLHLAHKLMTAKLRRTRRAVEPRDPRPPFVALRNVLAGI